MRLTKVAEENLDERLKAGLKHLAENKMEEACKEFEKAYKIDRDNATAMSYYGLCSALERAKIGLGLELCTKAIKKDFHKPEHYLNLGRVYLTAGNKKGAITVFLKGLRFAPNDKGLNDILVEIGVRKRPVIPFLNRSNPINRFLGIFFRRTLPGMFKGKPPEKKAD